MVYVQRSRRAPGTSKQPVHASAKREWILKLRYGDRDDDRTFLGHAGPSVRERLGCPGPVDVSRGDEPQGRLLLQRALDEAPGERCRPAGRPGPADRRGDAPLLR